MASCWAQASMSTGAVLTVQVSAPFLTGDYFHLQHLWINKHVLFVLENDHKICRFIFITTIVFKWSFVCLCGRVLTELVSKMKDMQMDKTELGCLRAIVLFNPGMSLSAIYIHLSAALINKVILNSAINYIKFQHPPPPPLFLEYLGNRHIIMITDFYHILYYLLLYYSKR